MSTHRLAVVLVFAALSVPIRAYTWSPGLSLRDLAPPPQSGIPIIAATGNQLQWSQPAPDLPTAQSYLYTAIVDGGATPVALTVACTGPASPFTCVAPLPVVTPGTHALTVTASVTLTGGGTLPGTPSAQCQYQIAAAPAAPTNLTIVKIVAALIGLAVGLFELFK